MSVISPYVAQQVTTQFYDQRLQREILALRAALEVYRDAHFKAWLNMLKSFLTGRSYHLLDLTEVEATHRVHAWNDAGTKQVSIRQIRGSGGRSGDFDRDFYPLQTHTRERWLSVAVAWKLDVALPAVELIQVGDIYYVLDGHHRISVARAMGQDYINAQVTVWQIRELAGQLATVNVLRHLPQHDDSIAIT